MRVQNYPLTESELAVMARPNWSADFASKLVGLLTRERDAFADLERQRIDSQEQIIAERRRIELEENSRINWHAVVSALLFVLALSAWPLTTFIDEMVTNKWRIALCVVLSTSVLAGASGATIRVVLDWATGVTRSFVLSTYNQYILLRYAALGVVAGGLAGVSFVLAQIFSAEIKPDDMFNALKRLVPFLILIGFAAGLTAEVVLSNIRKAEAPKVEVPASKK
jgi:hypothetical protein